MPARYRHIVWDWNGTLLDDVDYSIEVMNGLLRRRGLPPLDRTRYHEVFDFPVSEYYRRIGLDASDVEFQKLSVEFIAGYDARRLETKLHEGAAELLQLVQAAGLTQSILSAYRHETLCEIIAHFGLTGRFQNIAGLDNIFAHSKAELGRASIAALKLPLPEILLVGDTLHDCEVAAAIGVDCALVAAGHHPESRLRARCPQVFSDLTALAAWLDLSPLPAAVAAETSG
jgi:phosphoglycolate phosphatase